MESEKDNLVGNYLLLIQQQILKRRLSTLRKCATATLEEMQLFDNIHKQSRLRSSKDGKSFPIVWNKKEKLVDSLKQLLDHLSQDGPMLLPVDGMLPSMQHKEKTDVHSDDSSIEKQQSTSSLSENKEPNVESAEERNELQILLMQLHAQSSCQTELMQKLQTKMVNLKRKNNKLKIENIAIRKQIGSEKTLETKIDAQMDRELAGSSLGKRLSIGFDFQLKSYAIEVNRLSAENALLQQDKIVLQEEMAKLTTRRNEELALAKSRNHEFTLVKRRSAALAWSAKRSEQLNLQLQQEKSTVEKLRRKNEAQRKYLTGFQKAYNKVKDLKNFPASGDFNEIST